MKLYLIILVNIIAIISALSRRSTTHSKQFTRSYGGFSRPSFGGFSRPSFGGFSRPSFSGFSRPLYSGFSRPLYSGFSRPWFSSFGPSLYRRYLGFNKVSLSVCPDDRKGVKLSGKSSGYCESPCDKETCVQISGECCFYTKSK